MGIYPTSPHNYRQLPHFNANEMLNIFILLMRNRGGYRRMGICNYGVTYLCIDCDMLREETCNAYAYIIVAY